LSHFRESYNLFFIVKETPIQYNDKTGLKWDTFVSGVRKGADKSGITPIVQGALEIVENGTNVLTWTLHNLRQK
jgi:hypothetical protein